MKILQLCNKLPYPEKDGGAIAVSTITNGLIAAGCTVKMLSMNTSKHYIDPALIPKEFIKKTGLETVKTDTSVKALKAIQALLTGKSYNVTRFYSAEFKTKLTDILKAEKFDIIQMEGLYLTPYIQYIRQNSNAKIVLRAHNVEWVIWEKLAHEEKNPIKKLYLLKLAKDLKAYETRVINTCDALTVFTKEDKDIFTTMGCKAPVKVFPFGINPDNYKPVANANPLSLFFIGALDWMPNLQGLTWFLQNVWNKVNTTFPNASLHIAGRKMPEDMKNSKLRNVHFYGETDNAVTFMNTYGIMISPLFAGSGIRVKIIEAMALGKAVVATSVAAGGIAYTDGNNIVIANDSEQFFKAISKCLESIDFTAQLAKNARICIESNYNISVITTKLLQFYKDLIYGVASIN